MSMMYVKHLHAKLSSAHQGSSKAVTKQHRWASSIQQHKMRSTTASNLHTIEVSRKLWQVSVCPSSTSKQYSGHWSSSRAASIKFVDDKDRQKDNYKHGSEKLNVAAQQVLLPTMDYHGDHAAIDWKALLRAWQLYAGQYVRRMIASSINLPQHLHTRQVCQR
jgi:hypothetical protein